MISVVTHPKLENLHGFKRKQSEHWMFPNKKEVANNSKLSGFAENDFTLGDSKWIILQVFWWKNIQV